MDKKGIPRDKNERTEHAVKIITKCQESGFDIGDLYLDPIVLPVNVAQAQGTVLAVRKFAIADSKPALVTESAQRVDHLVAVAFEPVTPARIHPSRERVGHDVEIGRYANAVKDAVVAGVHDGGDFAGFDHPGEPAQEARSADAAAEGDDRSREGLRGAHGRDVT